MTTVAPVLRTLRRTLGSRLRRRTVAAALLITVAAVGANASLSGSGRTGASAQRAATAATGGLSVDVPNRIVAGAHFTVSLTDLDGTLPDPTTVEIDLVSTTSVQRLTATMGGSRTTVDVPGLLTTTSGALLVTAAVLGDAAGRPGATAVVEVAPADVVSGITPLAGPRSIVADGAHWTMVTALPVDRFGNAAPEGTPVRIHVRRPDGATTIVTGTVQDLLAGIRVMSGTLAGHTTIRVEVAGQTGSEVEVLEVAGPPRTVSLDAPERPLLADGRALVALTAGPLVDRYGNTLADGTSVAFTAEGPTGATTLTGLTIGGLATMNLESPSVPGTMTVRAMVDGVTSGALRLDFSAAVMVVPVDPHRNGDAVTVSVGPVLAALGGWAPDGSTVFVRRGSAVLATAVLQDGSASVDVTIAAGQEITVEVLGARTELVTP